MAALGSHADRREADPASNIVVGSLVLHAFNAANVRLGVPR